jgi:succinoglycan biosynthesis transport protein ExoP
MRELQNSIRDELQRIAETYKSDFEISTQNEDSIRKQLDQAVAQSQVTNEAQVALRELESNAQTYQALYDNFLQRYMESVQQQSFPITEARVLTAATRPLFKSKPKGVLVLGLATIVGLAFGFIAGAWRDFADRVFRTVPQVESILQTDCIALLPVIEEAVPKEQKGDQRHGVAVAKSLKSLDAARQSIVATAAPYSAIVDAPFSAYTEAIRSIKVTIDLSPTATRGRIIGFTSSVPNEGKSSTAVALARLTAQAGGRVLLVDCDLRNPSLSRLLSPGVVSGFQDVVRDQASFEKALWVDQRTGMRFLPANLKGRVAHSSEILASTSVRKFFDGLRNSYDYIFVDFSPLMPIVDVRVSTDLVDSYVYVVAWGDTRIDYVKQALHSARGVYDHLLGVVLNKVDLRSLGRYDGGGGSYYYHGNYQRYGYTA